MPLDDVLLRTAGLRTPECANRSQSMETLSPGDDKLTLSTVDRFRVPIGGQDIELQQLDYAHGGMSLLRLRIREGKRFTIFDIDPVTARTWGETMQRWAAAHLPAADGEGESEG